MGEVPDIILKTTLKELKTLGALETQATIGAGFWITIGDTKARYYSIEDIANIYPQMTSKQQRDISRMIKKANLTQQVVISFHMPDGALVIDTFTIE